MRRLADAKREPGLPRAGAAAAIAGSARPTPPLVSAIACARGGGVDSYARLVQRHLGRFLPGSPGIMVQNMPGAGSLRSVMALVNSPEDVVGTFSSSLLTEAISMPERVKIDFRNFASIGNVSEDIRVCYTRSALAVRWSDLLAREQ